mmetsp:Transcript_36625/g.78088  ORF Transcript_36625/g.78088 Transcript_36625/m.78088 type:complete len:245 (+) Transcript_36625:392-1126(+)
MSNETRGNGRRPIGPDRTPRDFLLPVVVRGMRDAPAPPWRLLRPPFRPRRSEMLCLPRRLRRRPGRGGSSVSNATREGERRRAGGRIRRFCSTGASRPRTSLCRCRNPVYPTLPNKHAAFIFSASRYARPRTFLDRIFAFEIPPTGGLSSTSRYATFCFRTCRFSGVSRENGLFSRFLDLGLFAFGGTPPCARLRFPLSASSSRLDLRAEEYPLPSLGQNGLFCNMCCTVLGRRSQAPGVGGSS